VLAIMAVLCVAQVSFFLYDKDRFPFTAFLFTKMLSVIAASIILLLIRLRVGGFGDSDDKSLGIDPISYHDKIDVPPPYNEGGWIAIIVVVGLNILEAVISQLRTKRGYANPALGIALIISLATQPSWKHLSVAWVLAYSIWNSIFTCRGLGVRAGIMHLGHNLIPLAGVIVFGIPDGWFYLRAHALGVMVTMYCFGAVWIPDQSWEWEHRWIDDCPPQEVLADAIMLPAIGVAWACLIVAWIPGITIA